MSAWSKAIFPSLQKLEENLLASIWLLKVKRLPGMMMKQGFGEPSPSSTYTVTYSTWWNMETTPRTPGITRMRPLLGLSKLCPSEEVVDFSQEWLLRRCCFAGWLILQFCNCTNLPALPAFARAYERQLAWTRHMLA